VEEPFAADLHARYGERVSLRVGAFPYPMPSPPPASQCEQLPDSQRITGLSVTIDPLPEPIRPMRLFETQRAVLRLRNRSGHLIEFPTGTPLGTIVERGGSVEVGGFGPSSGLLPAIGVNVRVPPGGEETMSVLLGVTSCDAASGYAVPPGDYDLVVLLDHPSGIPVRSDRLRIRVESP
jgi:hypothetical protein